MAAIYSGIHLKLKNPRTPWTDKLKLARFAWLSTQCLLPNKEQVLLDWTSHALTGYYSKKVDLPLEIVEGLWTYLDDILHSRKLNTVLSQGKTVRLGVAQVVSDRILECTLGTSSVSFLTILSCCHGILTSPVLSVTYTAKYELLVELVARLCGLACSKLDQQSTGEPLESKVLEVLLLALSTYLTVQRQQTNANRVFAQVTGHLLQPLCLLRHLLNTRVCTGGDGMHIQQHLAREIRSKVDAILLPALFLPDHLQSYKEELLSSKEESGSKNPEKNPAGKGLLCPVNTILTKLCPQGCGEDTLYYAVKSNSLPLLFKFALDSFCKEGDNKLLCFHLMTKLISALDFTDELSVKTSFSESNWSLALLALENILNSCLLGDIYNVAADRIHHGEVQLMFYRKVAQLLFSNAQTDVPAWYRCLKALLTLNHLILEPDLDELLSIVWVDADCVELQVGKARESLVSAVIQTYTKLRQLPRLFEELLDVVCRPAADELRQNLLSEDIQKSLNQCLLDHPPSQSLEICRLILERMQNDLIPFMGEKRNDIALKLFSLSVLLHVVLFGLKTLDNSSPVPIVRQTQNLMKEILAVTVPSLQLLDQNISAHGLWGEKIQEVSLLLVHTWAELDTLFQMYCSKYQSPVDPNVGDVDILFSTLVTKFFQNDQSSKVCSPMSKLLQERLVLHRMKKILVKNGNISDSVMLNHLREAAQFIIGKEEPSITLNCNHLWDVQLSSVDSDTYPVAHWFLVTSNLPLIAPYLGEEDVSYLSECFLNSLLQNDSANDTEKHGLSISLISKHMLESIVLCELPLVYSGVVKGVTKKIIGVVCTAKIEEMIPSVLKSCDEISDTSGKKQGTVIDDSSRDNEAPAAWKRLKAIAQEIMKCVEGCNFLFLTEKQVDGLLDLLKITDLLIPQAMLQEDYFELFLVLYFMAVCIRCDRGLEISKTIGLLRELFNLMASLLGKTSHSILKVEHGSNLLEAAVTSLSSLISEGHLPTLEDSAHSTFLQSVQNFIQCLLQTIVHRKSSVSLNLEKFTSFMAEHKIVNGELSSCSDKPHAGTPFSVQLYLSILSTLSHVMCSALGKNKQLDVTLTHLLEKIASVMGPTIQDVVMGQTGCVLSQSFSVNIMTGMVRTDLKKTDYQETESSEGAAKQQLCHVGLYRSFKEQILMDLCSSAHPMDVVISSVNYLSAYIAAAEKNKEQDLGDLKLEILQSIHKLLSGSWLSVSEVRELEGPVKNSLAQLMINISQEQFLVLLLTLRDGLVTPKITEGHHKDVLSTVILTKLLATCLLPEPCAKTFWLIAPQIISALVFIVKESSRMIPLTCALTVPTLDALTTLLRQGESLLSNSHHVVLVLGALQLVPLENQSVEDYHSAFEAIHEALFAIIQCHPQVMLKAAPSFLNCFYRLVTSIMHEGRQRGEAERGGDGEMLLKCARLVERMYSHIATTAEGFTVLSSFMVAQYVSELQRVTLQPDVKAHLTEGIYQILDLCVEQDVKFLNTTLQAGVKEVFHELLSSYKHYHKAQRQGEEKYTS
ncbi:unhealthy ribosome biogenesis protein 2 homolog [Chanos chanos]|uniref:Unhealthy ribosome biogenesis protein 2 homolog n=1 Tax=Chanos chanos TaxID=29144 RepID=A0A6J2V9X5_CHACN|nr:unhealthy ribosome biogenesis protein 2 homolog [Chanos chanos]